MTWTAAMLIAGCGAIDKKSQTNKLDQSLKAYAGSIRWSNFDTAALFAVPRNGVNTVSPTSLSGIKVTGYDIRIASINEAADEATVRLSFTFYDESRGTVGTINQDVAWYLNPDDKKGWLMDDSLPQFKR